MARGKPLAHELYHLARQANDVESFMGLLDGHPERAVRRIRNKIIGRSLARAGLWRVLFGGR
jgi:hypothetical protein